VKSQDIAAAGARARPLLAQQTFGVLIEENYRW
jgi:hypothetical protein